MEKTGNWLVTVAAGSAHLAVEPVALDAHCAATAAHAGTL